MIPDNPELNWDIIKFIIPMFACLVGWAWRVELRLASHDRFLDALSRIGKSLDTVLLDDKSRAERLTRLETKIDILLSTPRPSSRSGRPINAVIKNYGGTTNSH